MAVDFKPEGYGTVTPYVVVPGAEGIVQFMKVVLGARERMRMPGPNGTIGHAEVEIGDSVVMIADPPAGSGPTPAMLHVYVDDADAAYERALKAGAVSTREPKTEFYGDRMAGVRDAAGNEWYFATHVEDVSPEEAERRAAELAASGERA